MKSPGIEPRGLSDWNKRFGAISLCMYICTDMYVCTVCPINISYVYMYIYMYVYSEIDRLICMRRKAKVF